MRRIAIIGAGLSGLAAANGLLASGLRVALIDKGRSLGGRIASRRSDGFTFDHGLRYFPSQPLPFMPILQRWHAAGLIADWGGHFIGVPAMNAPLSDLVGGADLLTGCQVEMIRRLPAGWQLSAVDGPLHIAGNGSFSAVVLAIPAPQAATLAERAGLSLDPLYAPTYAPCWTLMAGFDRPLPLEADRTETPHDTLEWVSRENSKPGRTAEREALVAQAGADWSRRHLELDASEAGQRLWHLLVHNRRISEIPSFVNAHRWRYAAVEQAAEIPFLWDSAFGLGACGDWCMGGGAAGAFASGAALARAIAAGQGTA
jgi:predicted NAD/FAD-dependent oxidoreductase